MQLCVDQKAKSEMKLGWGCVFGGPPLVAYINQLGTITPKFHNLPKQHQGSSI